MICWEKKRFHWCSAEPGLEQLRPLWSLQGREWPVSFWVAQRCRHPAVKELGERRQGGEMAASPDKVYHESQRGLRKAPALVDSSHGELGSFPHWHMKRWLSSSGRLPDEGWCFNWRLVIGGINKMQDRGQEIGWLKCVAFKDNICWVFSTSPIKHVTGASMHLGLCCVFPSIRHKRFPNYFLLQLMSVPCPLGVLYHKRIMFVFRSFVVDTSTTPRGIHVTMLLFSQHGSRV